LHALGDLELDRRNLTEARTLFERTVIECKNAGEWEHNEVVRHGLGDLALEEGASEEACAWYLDGLNTASGRSSYSVLHCIGGLAAVAAQKKLPTDAATLWAAMERYSELQEVRLGVKEHNRYMARLAAVPPDLLETARTRWKNATAAEIEATATRA
jgi:hypothetical protein